MGFFVYWLKATIFHMARRMGTKVRARSLNENPNSASTGTGAAKESAHFLNISRQMLASVFVMWALGLLLAGGALALEQLFHWCTQSRRSAHEVPDVAS